MLETRLISALIDEAGQKGQDLVLDALTVNRPLGGLDRDREIPPRPGRSRWSARSPRHRSRMRQAWVFTQETGRATAALPPGGSSAGRMPSVLAHNSAAATAWRGGRPRGLGQQAWSPTPGVPGERTLIRPWPRRRRSVPPGRLLSAAPPCWPAPVRRPARSCRTAGPAAPAGGCPCPCPTRPGDRLGAFRPRHEMAARTSG